MDKLENVSRTCRRTKRKGQSVLFGIMARTAMNFICLNERKVVMQHIDTIYRCMS